jgi:hypothetical protein
MYIRQSKMKFNIALASAKKSKIRCRGTLRYCTKSNELNKHIGITSLYQNIPKTSVFEIILIEPYF